MQKFSLESDHLEHTKYILSKISPSYDIYLYVEKNPKLFLTFQNSMGRPTAVTTATTKSDIFSAPVDSTHSNQNHRRVIVSDI